MVDVLLRVAFAVGLVLVLYWKRRQIAEAIDNFKNNFPGGGPGSPMHPSPSNDAALIGRRRPARQHPTPVP
jgi:hypothetical protein